LLNKKISPILKLALLFSLWSGGVGSTVISSDRFLIKILDKTISFQDINFQLRNLKALRCIYEDSFVIQYFKNDFVGQLDNFISNMPKEDEEVKKYLLSRKETLKSIRYFFKMLTYAEDQKIQVSSKVKNLIRESAKENQCQAGVLYKDTLKTNFISLMEMEIYLRTRYGSQVKNKESFEAIRSSIEIFIESLDKQFSHEYFW
jgi:hypothetical protein